MEEEESKQPMIEILTSMPCKGSEEEYIDYIGIQFQNSVIYIWSCQEFRSLLTNDKGSLIEEAASIINNLPAQNPNDGKLSTKRKPMGERITNDAEDKLEETARNGLKMLMEIVDINLLKDKLNNSLQMEEDKSFNDINEQ